MLIRSIESESLSYHKLIRLILFMIISISIILIVILSNTVLILQIELNNHVYNQVNHTQVNHTQNLDNKIYKVNKFDQLNQSMRLQLLNEFETVLWKPDDNVSQPEVDRLHYADQIKLITLINDLKGQDLCCNKTIDILMFTFTSINSFDQRSLIRKTWGHDLKQHQNIVMLFVVGYSLNQTVNAKLQREIQLYNDILQCPFEEAYYGLTLKALTILRWTLLNCPKAKFVFKMDDDVLINVNNLAKFTSKWYEPSSISGILMQDAIVLRANDSSKWSIPYESYKDKLYPDYIVGPYLITNDSVFPLYHYAINHLPANAFDDVYITGILAQQLGTKRLPIDEFVRIDWLGVAVDDLDSVWFDQNILFLHNLRGEKLLKAWENVHKKQKRKKYIFKTITHKPVIWY